jgi:hypothetical protein
MKEFFDTSSLKLVSAASKRKSACAMHTLAEAASSWQCPAGYQDCMAAICLLEHPDHP